MAAHRLRPRPRSGRPRTPARRSGTRWSARRSTPPPARGCGSASSAAGTSPTRTSPPPTSRSAATRRACRWAPTCRPHRRGRRAELPGLRACATRSAPTSTASRSSRAGSTPRATPQEQVYDVAWSRRPPARTPTASCRRSATRSTSRARPGPTRSAPPSSAPSGQDPDFDPAERAFYYARVLEIPTPRWTAYDAVRFGIRAAPRAAADSSQERAYTSPIWYTPAG